MFRFLKHQSLYQKKKTYIVPGLGVKELSIAASACHPDGFITRYVTHSSDRVEKAF